MTSKYYILQLLILMNNNDVVIIEFYCLIKQQSIKVCLLQNLEFVKPNNRFQDCQLFDTSYVNDSSAEASSPQSKSNALLDKFRA